LTESVFAGEKGDGVAKMQQKSVQDSKQIPEKKGEQKKGGKSEKKSGKKSPAKLYFSNFQVGGGFEVGAPLHFKDTPDQTVDKTLALLYGARLAFLFGHYSHDDHRFGLAVNFDVAAKSSDRTLMYVTPYLIYNIGYPFTLETGLGYAISLGTDNFAENYDGLFTQVAVKYTFNSAKKHSPVGVSLGVTGKFILPFDDLTYISAFAGVSLEIMYRSNKLQ
jgi:hypothetical protein